MNKKVKNVATFYFSMGNGGIEKVVTLLIRKWKAMGYQVILFTDREPDGDDYIGRDEVERVILNTDYEKGSESCRCEQWQVAIIKYSIDIMVYHAWGNPGMKADREIFQRNNIPFIVYTHGVFSTIYHDRNQYTPLFAAEIVKCDLVISLTRISQAFYRMLGMKSEYMQNPIEDSLMRVKGSELNEPNIIWVGRMIPEKKPLDAIRIFAKIKGSIPEARLFMIGKGPEEKAAKKLCHEMDLENSVEFCGYVKDVEQYYERAGVMLYTSMYEGFSMVLLESKAYGIPCVMYDLPYLSMTENPQGMRIVEQDALDAAAEEAIKILKDGIWRTKLGKDARRSMEKMYVDYRNEQWEDIFEKAFEKSEIANSTEKQMLMLLLEHEEYGIREKQKKIVNSMTYRVGNKILAIPKKISRLYWVKRND